MTKENEQTTGRRSEGSAGTPREVSQRDQIPSGAAGAGRKNEEMAWAQRLVPEEPQPVSGSPVPWPNRTVFRKTELHGMVPGNTPAEQKKIRQRTLASLKGPDAVVLYQPFERAFRDFTCSLLEQQALIEEDLVLQIADLQQQIDAFERAINQARQASPENPEERA